jgi:hypothetical protein
MKKLKLAVDDLRVESFETERRGQARGTVRGADYGDPVSIVEPESGDIYCLTAPPCIPTNEETGGCHTCQGTCPATCVNTCTCPSWGEFY